MPMVLTNEISALLSLAQPCSASSRRLRARQATFTTHSASPKHHHQNNPLDMRLINTHSLEFQEFEPAVAPPYAILSHTWDSTEISFQDVQNDRKTGKEPECEKLIQGCRAAASHGYSYFWIDTCCIDKTNSVELSETINSMFRWYQQAGICLAYLVDVPPGSTVLDRESQFAKSRWFTRGWTLQELLAPPEVEFLASDWTRITSKTDSASLLADITGISMNFLSGEDLEVASIAMRMSWASRRVTTKAEDIAYCLMGIFDIQMPLLYGEGEGGAFRRLQQEIIKDSDDQSIFAWKADDTQTPLPRTTERRVFSLLARSPAAFEHSHDIVEAYSPMFECLPQYLVGIRAPTVFDNKGLHLSLPLIPMMPKSDKMFLAVLACSKYGKEDEGRLAIQLRDVSTNGGRYIRVKQHELLTVPKADILESAEYSNISVARGKDEDFVQSHGNGVEQAVTVNFEKTSTSKTKLTLRRISRKAITSEKMSLPSSKLKLRRISREVITSFFGGQVSPEKVNRHSSFGTSHLESEHVQPGAQMI
jgi:hypothetical protein